MKGLPGGITGESNSSGSSSGEGRHRWVGGWGLNLGAESGGRSGVKEASGLGPCKDRWSWLYEPVSAEICAQEVACSVSE